MKLGASFAIAGFLVFGLLLNLKSLGSNQMTAELKDRHVRPRRSIFLISVTSVSLAVSLLGSSPAKASDSVPADDSWQAAAEAASATPAELKAEVADGSLNLVVIRDVGGAPTTTALSIQNAAELDSVINTLSDDPSVIAFEPEVKFRAYDIALPAAVNPKAAEVDVNLSTLESSSNGSGITIAVIDSGVDARHIDLSGQVLDGVDFRDGFSYFDYETNSIYDCVTYTDADYTNTGRTKPVHADFGKYDPNGHGTHVAGIIAAKGFGVQGIAPGARILPVRVLDTFGSGDSSDVACGITWATDYGADIINMSLGSESESIAVTAAVKYALSSGVVVIAAAGNSGPNNIKPSYPAATKTSTSPDSYDVIAVGATSATGVIQSFSNRGAYVDVAAPGLNILSTCMASPQAQTLSGITSRTSCTSADGSGRYESLSGTSMAAPHIAGLVALIMSSNPSMTYQDVTETLIARAIDKGALGFDNEYGNGFVGAPLAINRNNLISLAAANLSAVTEESRLAAATSKLMAEQAAAKKRLADQKAAAAARLAASPPVVKKSLKVKALKKKRVSIAVAAPKGSKTVIQRKVGKKWKTVVSKTTVSKTTIKVSKSGKYRVRIKLPTGTVTSKSFRVK